MKELNIVKQADSDRYYVLVMGYSPITYYLHHDGSVKGYCGENGWHDSLTEVERSIERYKNRLEKVKDDVEREIRSALSDLGFEILRAEVKDSNGNLFHFRNNVDEE